MKGLLLKDIYMTAKYCRAYLLIAFLFLAISVVGSSSLFFLIYPMILSSMIPVTLFSYDERSKWDSYFQTLPYSRAQYVSVKYLMALISAATAGVLCMGAQCLRMWYMGADSWRAVLLFLPLLFLIGVGTPAITLPIIIKFGSEKGRIVYYAVIIVGAISGTALDFLKAELKFTFSPPLLLTLLLAAGIIIFAVSWLLSIRAYEKREL